MYRVHVPPLEGALPDIYIFDSHKRNIFCYLFYSIVPKIVKANYKEEENNVHLSVADQKGVKGSKPPYYLESFVHFGQI